MTSTNCTLATILEANERSCGNLLAYRLLEDPSLEGAEITYSELMARAAMVAGNLADAGVAGRNIALMAGSSIDYVAAFFGIIWAGGIAVPLAPARVGAAAKGQGALLKVDRLLSLANVAAVVADQQIASRLFECRDQAPALNDALVLNLADLGKSGSLLDRRAAPETAVIQFTSGSTSDPKGVCVTHSNFIANSATMLSVFGRFEDDMMLHWLPLYHDMGLIGGIVAPLCNTMPSTIIPATKFAAEPAYWLKAMSHVRGTISTAPNFAYQLCADRMTQEEIEALDLRHWRAAICGAEPVQEQTLQRFSQRFEPAGFSPSALFPTYGLAEATIYVSGGPLGAGISAKRFDRHSLENCGRALLAEGSHNSRTLVSSGTYPAEHEIVIVHPKERTLCADCDVGEIWLRGPGVAAGYWKESGGTLDTFGLTIEPWGSGFLATGDLGFLREGELYVTGRLKDLIILDGVNHYPQDIELAATKDDEAFLGCMSAAFQSDQEKHTVVLVQEVRKRDVREVTDQIHRIRQNVAEREQISLSLIVAVQRGAIPKTSSGKVARRKAKAMWESGQFNVLASSANLSLQSGTNTPSSATSEHVRTTIGKIWRETLRHGDFGLDSLFFEAGGTSLQLIALHESLQRQFGIEFPLIDLMEHATISLQAQLLDGIQRAEMQGDPIEPVGDRREPANKNIATRFAQRVNARALALDSIADGEIQI